MADPLEFKSFSLLFGSRGEIKILLTAFFSVPTVSYGTSFFQRTSRLCHESKWKNPFRILQYGARTRFVRDMSDGKLVLTNRFETQASLDSLDLK